MFFFDLMMYFASHVTMTDLLPDSTPALSTSLIDFNLNMKLKSETAGHGYLFNVKY